MTLWLIRSGSRGEHEQKFLDGSRVYAALDGWNGSQSAVAGQQACWGLGSGSD